MDDFNFAQFAVPIITGVVGWLLNKVVITPLGALIEKGSEACDVIIGQSDKIDEIYDKVVVRQCRGKNKKRRCLAVPREGSDSVDD